MAKKINQHLFKTVLKIKYKKVKKLHEKITPIVLFLLYKNKEDVRVLRVVSFISPKKSGVF